MNDKIKILIAEHNTNDAEQLEKVLVTGAIEYIAVIVDTEEEYKKAIENFIPDIILSEYSLPLFDGLTAYKIKEELAAQTPFIFVSGTSSSEEYFVELLGNGLTDYNLKDRLFSLPAKIRRALKESGQRKQKDEIKSELVKTEARLNESQALTKTGSWDFDVQADRLTWSEELYHVFATNKEAFTETHHSFLHLVDEADRELVFETSRHTQETGEPFTVDYHITTPDGGRRIIRECGYGKKDKSGTVTHLFGTAQDITDSKQAEDKLRESELRYRSLVEHASDAICIVDTNMKFTEINPVGCQLSGYTREEVLQLSVIDLLFEEELRINPLRINSLIPGKTFLYERKLKRKDGTGVEMELSAKMLDDGRVIMFIRDISERKKASQLLSESEAKFRAFFENSMDGILLTISDGPILAANFAACEIFRMTEAELCDAGRFELTDMSDPRVYDLLGERKTTGSARGELTFKRKDGSRFPGEISSVLFTDTYGRERTSMIIRDITKPKAAEEKLVQTSKELKHALKDLNKIMDASLDIICSFDEAGRFVSVNAASEIILGYQPNEIIGKKYIGFLHSEDVEMTRIEDERIRSGIHVTMFENRYIHKDGSIVPLLWSAKWDQNDNLSYCIAKNATEKKRLEKAFQIERQRFLDLYLHAPSCMGILKGANHVYEMANPLYLALINKKDIIGKTVNEVLPELEGQGFIELLDTVYKTGESWSANEMLVKLDLKGNGLLVDTYLNLLYQAHRNMDDAIDGIFFFAVDVTEQVISRKKIEESEKQYRRIVETAQEGIWLIDAAGRTTFVNNKLCKILEYPEAEIMGKTFYDFMDNEEREKAACLLQRKKEGYSIQAHLKFIAKTGKEVWTNVSAVPWFSEDGKYHGCLGMITDITESKKAEEKDRFQATLLNTIGQAAIATDLNGIINFWNKEAEAIYGWTAEEAIGKNLHEISPVQQTKDEAHQIMQELLQGHSWSGELMVQQKNGRYLPAFVNKTPIFDQQHQLSGFIGVSYDITDRKLAEVRLNELNDNLQQQAKKLAASNTELEQFAYVASHDLQEPLRMVSSFLSLLESRYENIIDGKGKQYIHFAVDGADRMRKIIHDLLDFSRVGRTEDNLEEIDLNDLGKEIKILFRKQIEEKGALITIDQLPAIHSYKSPLRQVFQNLIGNALKYSREDVQPQIHITAEALAGYWQFAVKDNGIGISEEYFEKIFILFQRLHNKNEFSGTGIGLAITKKIIEMQGGKIWVESEEEKGSTFYFTIKK